MRQIPPFLRERRIDSVHCAGGIFFFKNPCRVGKPFFSAAESTVFFLAGQKNDPLSNDLIESPIPWINRLFLMRPLRSFVSCGRRTEAETDGAEPSVSFKKRLTICY